MQIFLREYKKAASSTYLNQPDDPEDYFVTDEILHVIPPLLINVSKDTEVFPKVTAIIEELIDQYEIDSPDTMGNKILCFFSYFFY